MTGPDATGPDATGPDATSSDATGPRIEVSGLTKRFGDVVAVDGAGFTVEPGRVTGFLGPNGAGKTTTMRMIVGLVAPTSGTATVGGRRYRDIPNPSATVGAVFDASTFHPAHTARDHLRVYAAMGGHPDGRVDELLGVLGLAAAADRRTGGFSTGMRQRLNLATALLGDPPVLLLDEPGNGLDPEGTAWLRTFLRRLAGEGRTILFSSHALGEVRQIADDVVVIRGGRVVAAGALDGLAGAAPVVLVRSPDAAELARTLVREAPPGRPVRAEPAGPDAPEELRVHGLDAPGVAALAAAHGLRVHGLSTEELDLERLFLELTGGAR
ncbi:ATP-binding cassette domain-containing protein [Actinomadura sp. WAC 06369]|uniref:ATP-binding cassette domain-containing protein n=1 Tax=Actinomadura sp. WAC 06369 TaxID=2203193 RepID=UPI000F77DB2A|nr:ATP-binding cassette domain-containing protein [Actinomadura sp. WAC 06369]RSN69155.1 ABC transporter ATP-binding protein [Actinomadura sp. WAC 06369]